MGLQAITLYLGLIKAVADAISAVAGVKWPWGGPREPDEMEVVAKHLTITLETLEALTQDIQSIESRFQAAVANPTLSTQEKNDAEKEAREGICRHVQRVRELNRGALPTEWLRRIEQSFCSR